MSDRRPRRDTISAKKRTSLSLPRGRILTRLLLTSCAVCLYPYFCFADFTGPVVSVLDGDTIEVLHNGRAERIRLSGIDCPEKGQAYGNKARQAAAAFVFGKQVTLQTHGQDKYGRTLGDVILPDGTNVNLQLVKDGWCWWYRKYAPGNMALEELERDAREAKRGLWVDPAPIPPWVYRKARRGHAPDWIDMEAPHEEAVPLP